jgi:hypothetical protein
VSLNDLVDDQRVDALTGTAVLNGTPVDVEPLQPRPARAEPERMEPTAAA